MQEMTHYAKSACVKLCCVSNRAFLTDGNNWNDPVSPV